MVRFKKRKLASLEIIISRPCSFFIGKTHFKTLGHLGVNEVIPKH